MTQFGTSAFWDYESEFPESWDESPIPTSRANQTTKGFVISGSSLVGGSIHAHTKGGRWHKGFLVKRYVYTLD